MEVVRHSDDYKGVEYIGCALDNVITPFTDNKFGKCCSCGVGIVWRPEHPDNIKKICMSCAMIVLLPGEGGMQ